jgi:ribose transport system permease protein
MPRNSGVEQETPTARGSRFRLAGGGRSLGLAAAALLLFFALSLHSPELRSAYSISVISRQIAFFSLLGLGQAVCIVVGGMNLSLGAIGAICTVALGLLLDKCGLSGWLAVPITLAVGAGAGLLNGLLITRLKIDSFIVTLSMMFIYMGLRSGISGGAPYRVPDSFCFIGQEALGLVPYMFITAMLVLTAFGLMFRHTRLGRGLLAVGGNAEASRLSGIRADAMIVWANALSGFLAALAAILWASKLATAAPQTGDDWLIISFAVAIIGGTGLTGGAISATGILMGATIFMLIKHGLVVIKANDHYANSFQGLLILLTIVGDRARELYGKRR